MISPGLFLAQRNRGFHRGTGPYICGIPLPEVPACPEPCRDATRRRKNGFFNHETSGFLIDLRTRNDEFRLGFSGAFNMLRHHLEKYTSSSMGRMTSHILLVCGWETLGSSWAPHLIGNMNTHSSLAPS